MKPYRIPKGFNRKPLEFISRGKKRSLLGRVFGKTMALTKMVKTIDISLTKFYYHYHIKQKMGNVNNIFITNVSRGKIEVRDVRPDRLVFTIKK